MCPPIAYAFKRDVELFRKLHELTQVMTVEEANKKVESTATAPRVTEASIKDKIGSVSYLYDDITTICIITLYNGFKVIGHSTPASVENFQKDVGETFAYENAFRQLWQLEGYHLKDVLWWGDQLKKANSSKLE